MDHPSKIIEILNSLPVGTIITLIGVVGALYGLVTGQIDYLAFAAALGLSGVGGGAIGEARNRAGHGVGPNRTQR